MVITMLGNEPVELVGNALCLNFVNTVNRRPDPSRDWLSSGERLLGWASDVGLKPDESSPDEAEALLPALRALREDIHGVFAAIAAGEPPSPDRLAAVAHTYAAALPYATWQLQGARMVAVWPPPRRAADLAWHVSASAMDLLWQGPLDRVGRCPGCGWLFLDTSRNGQRRWCSMATCGSRTKAARYFARSRRSANMAMS